MNFKKMAMIMMANSTPTEQVVDQLIEKLQAWKAKPVDSAICEACPFAFMLLIKHEIGHSGIEQVLKDESQAEGISKLLSGHKENLN